MLSRSGKETALVKRRRFGGTRTALCRLGQEAKKVDRAHGLAAEMGVRGDGEPRTGLGNCTGEAKRNSSCSLSMCILNGKNAV